MRLAGRIIAVSLISVVLLTSAAGYIMVRNAQLEYELQQRQSAERISQALSLLLIDAWRSGGQSAAARLLRQGGPASSLGLDLRWIALEETLPWQRDLQQPPRRSSSTVQIGNAGERLMHTYVPLFADGQPIGGLEFIGSLAPLERQTSQIVWNSLGLIGLFSLASIAATYFLGIRWIGRPLQALTAKADRIGRGDFTQPLSLAHHDELGELAESLNQMCDRLSAQRDELQQEASARIAVLDQLRHADRLKTVGQLASGVAHEIGTPLNVISGRAGLIASQKLTSEQIVDSALAIKKESDHIADIVRQLLAFARLRPPNLAKGDVREVVSSTLHLVEQFAQRKEISLIADLGDWPLQAEMDAGQIQQVLTNILMNAIQAQPAGGQIHVSLSACDSANSTNSGVGEPTGVAIAVTDHGSGIPSDLLDQIFDPFFTTKQVGEGTGLGLSIALGIIQEHGGTIDVTSEIGRGTQFIIKLPIQRRTPSPGSKELP